MTQAKCKNIYHLLSFILQTHLVFRSGTDDLILLSTRLVLAVVVIVGASSSKKRKASFFQSDPDEICQECLSCRHVFLN